MPHAYLAAITRDVPTYGETALGADPRWLGSVRWRRLRAALRELPFENDALRLQWLLFLDVLESEGSMGFTQPDSALFGAWETVRRSSTHIEGFLVALQVPLLQALQDALGSETSADFYRGRGGRPVISKSWNGIVDIPFRVPADVRYPSVRAGVFAYNPPARFYVSPHHGRRLSARRNRLPATAREQLDRLLAGEFREYDVHAFLELSDELLSSEAFEERVLAWTHQRFVELAASGVLAEQHQLGAVGQESVDDEAQGLESES